MTDPAKVATFTCAICGKKPSIWPCDRDPEIAPICKECERVSGYDWAGRARYRTKPTGGSFMDRRNAVRILALADELAQTAKRIKWSPIYGCP